MKNNFFLLLFLIVLSSKCFTENFLINKIFYITDGITKKNYLLSQLDISENQFIDSQEDLSFFIQNLNSKINNLRLFDSFTIDYEIISQQNFNNKEYTIINLTINTVESNNSIIVPYPKYDTNEGFVLKAKYRDYNFLGTLTLMNTELLYAFTEKQDHKIAIEHDSYIPILIKNFGLAFLSDLSLDYLFIEKSTQFDGKVGVDFLFPYYKPLMKLQYLQYGEYNLPRTSENNWLVKEKLQMSFPFYFSNFTLSNYINIIFTSLPNYLIQNQIGLTFLLNKFSWQNNFRTGYFGNANTYLQLTNLIEDISYSFENINCLYKNFTNFGLSTRISFFYNPEDFVLGDSIRGYTDETIYSNHGVFINIDLPITIININKNKFYDFEMQISPIIDLGYVDSFLFSAGLEVIVYPRITKSIQLRASGAISPNDFELFIGIGLFY